MNALNKKLSHDFALTIEEVAMIAAYFEDRTLKKEEFFLKSGQFCQQFAFLESGIVREFLFVEDKEVTKWIATGGYFIVDLASFMFDFPTKSNWQALTDCEIWVMSRQSYLQLEKVMPKWKEIEKALIVSCFRTLEDRVTQHLALSAEERYNQLFAQNRDLFNTVPLQYLASALGMTPETLSRIRKKQSS